MCPMLGNGASGSGIGLPGRSRLDFNKVKHINLPAGRPSAGRAAAFEAFPPKIQPKSKQEARFLARKHCCTA